jgi:hypothetical protein
MTPTTEAVSADCPVCASPCVLVSTDEGWSHYESITEQILAEARVAVLRELRVKVEELYGQVHPMCAIEDEPTDHKVVSRKAVLHLIDRELAP